MRLETYMMAMHKAQAQSARIDIPNQRFLKYTRQFMVFRKRILRMFEECEKAAVLNQDSELNNA